MIEYRNDKIKLRTFTKYFIYSDTHPVFIIILFLLISLEFLMYYRLGTMYLYMECIFLYMILSLCK